MIGYAVNGADHGSETACQQLRRSRTVVSKIQMFPLARAAAHPPGSCWCELLSV